jgi:hypothetical protein
MKSLFVLLVLASLAGCDSLPKDADGTSKRVQTEHRFQVGIIADGGDSAVLERERLFLAAVARASGATPQVHRGASEPLLLALEDGQLDLVVGLLAPDSPWLGRVALLPTIGEPVAPQHLVLTGAARNGENRWIMMLERQANMVRAQNP